MNSKIRKLIKFIYSFIIMFLIINMFIISNVFAAGVGNMPGPQTKVGQTVVKTAFVASQVLVSGYFVIRLTILGIKYFIAVSADEKAANKNRLTWTLVCGVIAYLAIYLFSYAVGLY